MKKIVMVNRDHTLEKHRAIIKEMTHTPKDSREEMTPYEELRDIINTTLPDRETPSGGWERSISIADILRALNLRGNFALFSKGELRKIKPIKNTGGAFEHEFVCDINLPHDLSTPENSSACEELIKLLK